MTTTPDLLPITWPPYADRFVLPPLLQGWLDCVVATYADAGVPLPDRQYWTIGQTAHDCEQAVLCVQQMFLGTSGGPVEATICNGPRGLTFTMEVLRCVPTVDNRGRAPEGDKIEAASVNPVIDMELLMDSAKCFDTFSQGIVATVDVIQAAGGLHGALGTYTVNL